MLRLHECTKRNVRAGNRKGQRSIMQSLCHILSTPHWQWCLIFNKDTSPFSFSNFWIYKSLTSPTFVLRSQPASPRSCKFLQFFSGLVARPRDSSRPLQSHGNRNLKNCCNKLMKSSGGIVISFVSHNCESEMGGNNYVYFSCLRGMIFIMIISKTKRESRL